MTHRASARGLLIVALALGQWACSSEPLEVPPPSDRSAAPSPSGGDFASVDYPAGPYGHTLGSIMPNLEFLGWHDPVSAGYDPAEFEVVRVSDYYNPGGTRGDVKLLLVNASAVWCSVCRAELRHMHEADLYRTYRGQGLEIFGVLFEDSDYEPAKPEDLELWGSYENHAIEFPLVLDPGFKVGAFFTSDATPLNMLVDAYTMQIVDVSMGYDPSEDSSYWQMIEQRLASY